MDRSAEGQEIARLVQAMQGEIKDMRQYMADMEKRYRPIEDET